MGNFFSIACLAYDFLQDPFSLVLFVQYTLSCPAYRPFCETAAMTASLSVDMLTCSTGLFRLTAATISSLHHTTNTWSSGLRIVVPFRLVRLHLLISKRASYVPSVLSKTMYTAAHTAFKDTSAKPASDGVPMCCAGLVDLRLPQHL